MPFSYVANAIRYAGVGRLKEVSRVPEFKCADIGMQCGFKAEAPSREELMMRIGMHACQVHNMSEMDQNTLKSIQNAIKY